MSEDLSEDMSEKNVRNNVRIGCQKRWKEDMSEKDVRKYVRRNITKNVYLYWTVSIEFQAPRRLKTDVSTAILA